MSTPEQELELDERGMLWSGAGPRDGGRHLVVLMHGVWGIAADMAPLFDVLPPGAVAVSLQGRLPLGERRAWGDGSRFDPEGLEASARAVSSWLDGLRGWASVGLVGYSQGGAVALQLVRRHPRRFAYAVTLSGFLATAEDERDAEVAAVRPAVLSCHGALDDAIPPDWVAALEAWMQRCTSPTVRRYPELGHHMSDEELADVGAFIAARLR